MRPPHAAAPLLILASRAAAVAAFSSGTPPSFGLTDRFRAVCPADAAAVRRFDPALVDGDDDDDDVGGTWAAVYRTSNNLPSVLYRDDFLSAMKIATSVAEKGAVSPDLEVPGGGGKSAADETDAEAGGEGVRSASPVAVARLRPSPDFPGSYVMDSLRCVLKKEDISDDCDGGSEHCEALSVCVDELLLDHLRSPDGRNFNGAIRCKATLYSGKLLEARGFGENEELSRDMATHISSLDGSMEKYAERAVSTDAKSPKGRERALEMLSLLGRLDRGKEMRRDEDAGEEDYDPWAGSNIFYNK